MADLEENCTIKELCTWLQGNDGKEFLDIMKKYVEEFLPAQFKLMGVDKNAIQKYVKEEKELYDVLIDIEKTKPMGATAKLPALKRALNIKKINIKNKNNNIDEEKAHLMNKLNLKEDNISDMRENVRTMWTIKE